MGRCATAGCGARHSDGVMRRLITAAGVAVMSAGCASTVSVQHLTSERYQPTEHVDVFHGEPVGPEVLRIARLTLQMVGYDEERAEARLVEAARTLGADAIIVEEPVRSRVRSSAAPSATDPGVRQGRAPGLVSTRVRVAATAIRYPE